MELTPFISTNFSTLLTRSLVHSLSTHFLYSFSQSSTTFVKLDGAEI